MREETEMKNLYKSETNKMISGVCGGIAEYFDIDASLVRLGFVLFAMTCGIGIPAYIAAAILLPKKEDLPEQA